jgi:hypothetical protein
MRVRRTHKRGMDRIGQTRIIHETASAPDECVILDARHVVRAGGAGCHESSKIGLLELRL